MKQFCQQAKELALFRRNLHLRVGKSQGFVSKSPENVRFPKCDTSIVSDEFGGVGQVIDHARCAMLREGSGESSPEVLACMDLNAAKRSTEIRRSRSTVSVLPTPPTISSGILLKWADDGTRRS